MQSLYGFNSKVLPSFHEDIFTVYLDCDGSRQVGCKFLAPLLTLVAYKFQLLASYYVCNIVFIYVSE